MLDVEVGGERMSLSPQRVMWWAARRTLILADAHFGKAASFRHAGIPVPESTTMADLSRLSMLVKQFMPERVVILGDLIHAVTGRSAEVIDACAQWRASFASLDVLLVRGNHDRKAGDPPTSWNMQIVGESMVDGPFVYHHEPMEDDRGYVLCGHIHPAVSLYGAGGSNLRAPCFWIGKSTCVLPAFGSFTGMKAVRPVVGDRVFVVGDGHVIEAPTRKPTMAKAVPIRRY